MVEQEVVLSGRGLYKRSIAFPPADNKPDPPRRKRPKKDHDSDDDFEVITRTTPSSRKTRRENCSAQKARSHGISSGSPVATRVTRQARTDQNQMKAVIILQAAKNPNLTIVRVNIMGS